MHGKSIFLSLALLALCGCGLGAEAPRVDIPIVVSSEGIGAATTDLGYTVTVTAFRAAIRDVELAQAGEGHLGPALLPRSGSGSVPALLPRSGELFHPGHTTGGEITGELPGALLIDWMDDGALLGTAELIAGAYESVNFTFRRAGDADGLDSADPLRDHTFHIEGTADDGSGPRAFQALVRLEDEESYMIGAPFEQDVAADAQLTLALQAFVVDPVEGDTLFDRVDFAALPTIELEDGSEVARVAVGGAGHTIIKRNLKLHDHYGVVTR